MINKEHKDRLYKMIFGNPEHRQWTLNLYNAVNGSNYDDPSQITYNTIGEVLYMGMRNDVSFVLDMWLNIYGHQSTLNPNMPVRCLMYLGRLWSKQLIGNSKWNIYGKKVIELPAPKCVVFYNGTEEEPDELELKLSDAFPEKYREKADVELKVRMLNINAGHNKELLEKCRPLYEYSWLVAKIREYNKTMEIEDAVDQVLKDMPDSFGIKPYLISNREEVRMSILTEYDEAKTMACFKEEGREEGEDLLADVIKRIRNGETPEKIIASGVSPQTVEKAEDVVSLFS
ncbi:MAG: hypothetical protein J6O73_12700 [Lachnospiraceae bacterium]|nr:hypothetical protein [Lachnospiraceae bacterium]